MHAQLGGDEAKRRAHLGAIAHKYYLAILQLLVLWQVLNDGAEDVYKRQFLSRSPTCLLNVRMVPCITAVSGMILALSPALIFPTVMVQLSKGDRCSATISWIPW